jgi:hypothetical protein
MFACLAVNRSSEPNTLVVCIDFDQRDALIAAEDLLSDRSRRQLSVCARAIEPHPQGRTAGSAPDGSSIRYNLNATGSPEANTQVTALLVELMR